MVFIDGVAGLGKTTLIKRLGGNLADYAEYVDFCKKRLDISHEQRAEFHRFYPIWYRFVAKQDLPTDRSPVSALLYYLVFNDCNETMTNQVFGMIGAVLDEPVACLLPTPGTHHHLLQVMKRRDNNLDTMTIEYIEKQVKVFEEFVRRFDNVTGFYINVSSLESWEATMAPVYNFVTRLQKK